MSHQREWPYLLHNIPHAVLQLLPLVTFNNITGTGSQNSYYLSLSTLLQLLDSFHRCLENKKAVLEDKWRRGSYLQKASP